MFRSKIQAFKVPSAETVCMDVPKRLCLEDLAAELLMGRKQASFKRFSVHHLLSLCTVHRTQSSRTASTNSVADCGARSCQGCTKDQELLNVVSLVHAEIIQSLSNHIHKYPLKPQVQASILQALNEIR